MMKNFLICIQVLFVACIAQAEFMTIRSCDFDQLTDIADLSYYYPAFKATNGVLSNDAALGAKSFQLTTTRVFQNIDGQIGTLDSCVVDFYINMATDVNTASNIDYNRLDFMNSAGSIFAGIGFKPEGAGKGTFAVQMFSGASGYFTRLTGGGGIPINSWEHLRIAIKLTNIAPAKPTGTLTVSRELAGAWQVIAQSNFTSFSDFSSSTKGVMRCKFFGNDIVWNIDEVKIGVEAGDVSQINANLPLSISFYDDFEGTLNAYQGSTGTWAVLTTDQAVSGTYSVVINDNGGNDWLAKPITTTTETWVDFQFMVNSGTGNTGPYGGIDFKGIASDTTNKVPLGIHYKAEGSGYGLYLLDGSSGYYTQLVTDLPLDTWKQLKIGVRILSPGTGLVWLYMKENGTWQTILNAKVYVAFQQLDTGFDLLQFTSHGNSIAVDDFTVGNPLYCGMGGTQYLFADYNKDCYVNLKDFAQIAETWLDCTDPANANCN